jgi:hypothetical protein
MSTASVSVNPENPGTIDIVDANEGAALDRVADTSATGVGETTKPVAPPANDAPPKLVVDMPPQKSAREAIFAAAAARRREQMVEGEPVFDNAGTQIPSWMKPAEVAPEPANDQAANDDKTETFKLKVLGNELTVTFDELAKQAGLEPDEAKDLPKASLIRLAQKNAAADAYLDEAKSTAKSARSARATGDTPPADRTTPTRDDRAETEDDRDANTDADPDQDDIAEAIKEIQFGDEKDAVEKLRKAVRSEAQREAVETRQRERHETVQREIGSAVTTFEAANADIIKDGDLAPVFYGRYLVDEVKQHLTATGKFPAENIDRIIQTPQDALAAYEGHDRTDLGCRRRGRLPLLRRAQRLRSASRHAAVHEVPPALRRRGRRAEGPERGDAFHCGTSYSTSARRAAASTSASRCPRPASPSPEEPDRLRGR